MKIHPAGLALFGAAFLFADSHFVLAAISALLLHEAAHVLAMQLCGMHGCMVEITPFGGMIDAKKFETFPPYKQALVSAAGVAASAAMTFLCMRFLPHTLFVVSFFQSNLSLAVVNALPLWPLDGARVITALAIYAGIEQRVKKMLSWLTVAAGIGFVLLGLYGVWKGVVNPSLLAAGPYLCYTAGSETVSAKVRRLEAVRHKLWDRDFVPVTMWAGNADSIQDRFAAQLARGGEGRYQVAIAVDPSSGEIRKCWTEQEMLNHLFSSGRN